MPQGYTLAIGLARRLAGAERRGYRFEPSFVRAPRAGGRVRGLDWHDDLGGMGAGYAAALNGTLFSALGPEGEPVSQADLEAAERRRHPARRDSGDGPSGRLDAVDHERRVRRQAADRLSRLSSSRGCRQRTCRACRGVLRASRRCFAAQRASRESARRAGGRSSVVRASDAERAGPRVSASLNLRRRSTCCAATDSSGRRSRIAKTVACQLSILVVTDGPRGSMVRYGRTRRSILGCWRLKPFPRTRSAARHEPGGRGLRRPRSSRHCSTKDGTPPRAWSRMV